MMFLHRTDTFLLMAFLLRILGFVLVFVGVLVAVVFVSIPGGLYTNPSGYGSSFLEGVANGALAGRILIALGLFLLAAGAGTKLHWSLRYPAQGSPDEIAWAKADRQWNGFVFALCLVLLIVVFLTINIAPPIPGGLSGIP
jgi:Na+-transporting NADH:ubiquinone oxidoreductase subunit NqrD